MIYRVENKKRKPEATEDESKKKAKPPPKSAASMPNKIDATKYVCPENNLFRMCLLTCIGFLVTNTCKAVVATNLQC